MKEKLSTRERARFEACKTQIADGLQTCFDTGAALTEIRDSKLYREDWDSFEQFCRQTYQIGRAHAYRLIEAWNVGKDAKPAPNPLSINKNLSPIGDTVKNEGQARALAKVPPETRPEVLRKAAASGQVTAKSISEARRQPEIRLDTIGRVIPNEIIPDWDRAATVAARLRSCSSEIKLTVERGLADKDIIFAEITNPTIAEASGLNYTLSQITPHAVCPNCQGRTRNNCQLCRKRGWISKYLFNSPAVSAATKAILEKVTRK